MNCLFAHAVHIVLTLDYIR